MSLKSYQELIVWQLGMKIAKETYSLTKNFPKQEVYGLTNQMQRAAVSIPANIAEGHARSSTKEFLRFISIAQGSLAELETHLLLATELEYCTKSTIEQILKHCSEESKMLVSLYRTIKAKSQPRNLSPLVCLIM
jgi:four helix bundle protein